MSSNQAQAGTIHNLVQADTIHGDVHIYSPRDPLIEFPYQVGLPPPRAAGYQRRVITATISDMLDDDGVVILGNNAAERTEILSGLGGVGKTQLAADFALTSWENRALDLLVWITATSRDAIMSTYAQLAVDIGVNIEENAEVNANRLLEWLARATIKWLVVLDDVQRPSDLHELWPPRTQTGRTIVTTRRRDAALRGHDRHMIDVDVFTPEEALGYFRTNFAGREWAMGDAVELGVQMGHLPLALAQASAYMIDRSLSCNDYLARLADRRRTLSSILPEGDVLPDHHRTTVAAAWSLSIEQADRLTPVGLARPLLEIASLLAPNGIPLEVFRASSVLNWLSDLVGEQISGDDAVDGLGCLNRLSLITLEVGTPARGVRVHALVQRTTRDQLPSERFGAVMNTAAEALCEIWPPNQQHVELGRILRANADALRTNSGENFWRCDAWELAGIAAASLHDAGLTAESLTYCIELNAEVERYLGKDHVNGIAVRNSIAGLYLATGDINSAKAQYEQVVRDGISALGPDHAETVEARFGLADCQGEFGDPAGAVKIYNELLSRYSPILGDGHNLILMGRASRSRWKGASGDYLGALAELDDLLPKYAQIYGSDNPNILALRNNRALWQRHVSSAETAIGEHEEVLRENLRTLGPDNPLTLVTRFNIASEWGYAGFGLDAVVKLEELLIDRVRVLGPDHLDTLKTRAAIARWRGEGGELSAAIAVYEELLPDGVRIYGPDHSESLKIREAIADCLGRNGNPADAILGYEKLLVDRARILGADHIDTLDTRAEIAMWRGESGDSTAAIAEYEQLLADMIRLYGPVHAHPLRIRVAIAQQKERFGDTADAMHLHEEIFADLTHLYPAEHPELLKSRAAIAGLRGDVGDVAGAIAAFEELLVDEQRVYGVDHVEPLKTRAVIALLRSEEGDMPSAIASYQEILADCIRILGVDHKYTLEVGERLELWLQGDSPDEIE